MSKETILTHLRLQHHLHSQQLNLYQNELATDIQAQFSDPLLGRDARLWDATRRMGEIFEEMTIRWLDETIAMIEQEF